MKYIKIILSDIFIYMLPFFVLYQRYRLRPIAVSSLSKEQKQKIATLSLLPGVTFLVKNLPKVRIILPPLHFMFLSFCVCALWVFVYEFKLILYQPTKMACRLEFSLNLP